MTEPRMKRRHDCKMTERKAQTRKITALFCVCFVIGFLHLLSSSYTALPVGRDYVSSRPVVDGGGGKIDIAYAISLFMCGNDGVHKISGLLDSAMVLKHSIDQIHKSSKYGYKMYAIVHPDAIRCSEPLQKVGYNILVRDSLVQKHEIQGDYLRSIVEGSAMGMGIGEFLRLHAYNITWHEIVVHVDMDFMFLQPQDELYDAMLLDPNSRDGIEARAKVVREKEPFVLSEKDSPMPDRIDAFFTRDYPQPWPGKVACFQGGYLVLRPSEKAFLEYVSIVKQGDYRPGIHNTESGWGGKGYGWLYACETYQGIVPYYYDILHPGTAVELDGCIYNHMGINVLYEAGGFNFARPKLRKYKKFKGQCRNGRGTSCDDCRRTPVSQIKSHHFTICGKPWKCSDMAQMPALHVNFTQCNEMQKKWTGIRFDLEQTLGKEVATRNGTHATDIYRGICKGDGIENYIPINVL